MEGLGLAVVVMLVAMAMLFTIMFVITDDNEPVGESTIQKEVANNFIAAMLNTNVRDCSNYTLTDLFIDCAQGEAIDCNGDYVPDSCSAANSTAELLLNSSIMEWAEHNYMFRAYTRDENLTYIEYGACTGSKEQGAFALPTTSQTLLIRLDVCSG